VLPISLGNVPLREHIKEDSLGEEVCPMLLEQDCFQVTERLPPMVGVQLPADNLRGLLPGYDSLPLAAFTVWWPEARR